MNVLHVNYTDKLGNRFNGGALIAWLRANGHEATHAVGVKQATGDTSFNMSPHPYRTIGRVVLHGISRIERVLSLQNILYPQSFLLPFNAQFKKAEILHFHIIHNGLFSYLALPWLTKLKPAVWTLHDPWAFTGHCIHPFECEGWKTGCSPCPHLDYPFAIRKDRAWLNYKIKHNVYGRSNLELIVSSEWMKKKVELSPLLGKFKIHLVPFGVDLDTFKPGNKVEAKTRLGIPPERVVVGLRALGGSFKGLEYSLAALRALPDDISVHILTCQETDLCSSLAGKFPITELGDIVGDDAMALFFQATDIHLMPSMAESFGMMAMEAAACGVPSIVFSGTPLGEICFAPEGGIVVEKGNTQFLTNALLMLVSDVERRSEMGRRARELAIDHYDFDKYARKTLEIYESIISKCSSRSERN